MSPDKREQCIRILLPLVVLAFVCALILVITDTLTRERIADNILKQQLQILKTVMPLSYDNELYDDVIEVLDPGQLGNENSVSVFRARNDTQPIGVVLIPIIAKGYTGKIKLVVGIAYDGTLLGVQVLEHQETEGLGDGIDQDKTNWIQGFTNHSLANTPAEAWAVKAEGGEFDQLSGATITPREVINAVRKSLEFYEINRDSLYLE
ncbi:MAG: electron transport complex subunit RsxG [Gammaproteobacteria bacterium]